MSDDKVIDYLIDDHRKTKQKLDKANDKINRLENKIATYEKSMLRLKKMLEKYFG